MSKVINIEVVDKDGCDGCAFEETRMGQSDNDAECCGCWLMIQVAKLNCNDGFQFSNVTVQGE